YAVLALGPKDERDVYPEHVNRRVVVERQLRARRPESRTPPHLRRDRLKDRPENLPQYGAERLDERVQSLRAPCGLSFAAASCLARRHSRAILGGGPDHLEAILHTCSRAYATSRASPATRPRPGG